MGSVNATAVLCRPPRLIKLLYIKINATNAVINFVAGSYLVTVWLGQLIGPEPGPIGHLAAILILIITTPSG